MPVFKNTKRPKDDSPPKVEKVVRKKSPQTLGKIENFEIPLSPQGWKKLRQAGGLQHLTINTLPKDLFGSASRPSNMQYVMLRCYSPGTLAPAKFGKKMAKFGFDDALMGQAANLLSHSQDWKRYIRTIEEEIPTHSLRETQDNLWPGSFMAAKRLQEQTATVEGTHDRTRRACGKAVEEYSDAEDEATPNAALLVLLQQITHLVEDTGLEWVLNRTHFLAKFGGERKYNAYTDGVLRSTKHSDVFSIVETKRTMRDRSKPAIIAQEACELVAWLMTSPNLACFNDHFLLFSQDRHQIFLTCAKYKKELEDYLKENKATEEFLVMETFGPWDAENSSHIVHFAQIVIAAILIAQANS
ncbi:hypothetical protein AtubIFM56815_010698 [Aspergillus tubingensis]|uniref:Uncharacterized protein n=1 Tax=Aspergillus tubingensis TaxID=5068 RepID=A0A8H3SMT2_ASPTU|nr:fungal specific transcription factor domain family protein [Aspergillus tubingensis]GFN12431.1 fungal specific transcription factor domain family protein [Aspergillus tubingensis]GLA86433.1 hypothetical protein AtubIFM56815_010698 [Aspergillus tubingensis]GLB19864.1 hypothetical protein AtubIFM61612_009786 [Aspergillus tubingensis]